MSIHWGGKVDSHAREQLHHVSGPAGSHCRGAESVFQDQIPADDPGEDFAQRGIPVSVGRSRDGNQGCKLRVAEASKRTGDSGEGEGEHDGGPGILSGHRSGEHEDAGADDGADAEGDEVSHPESAFESVLALFVALLLDHGEGLLDEKIKHGLCAA